jgi:probable phosphoglycerate mutase
MASAERPASTLVLLVRHAQTPTTGSVLPGRAPGLHLSDEGRRQVDAAAKRLVAVTGVARVYASPLERAQETAGVIASALGLAVATEPDLIELDVGDWTGRRLDEVAKLPEWRVVQAYPSSFRFPGGESFLEMQCRMVAAIGRIVERHPGVPVVAVSHADPIKAAVAHALGTPLDLFQRIVIGLASVSGIAHGHGGPMVLTVNSIDGDLASLLPKPEPAPSAQTSERER